MASPFPKLRSVKGPITLFVVTLVLVLVLAALWNVVLAIDYQHIRRLARQAAEREGEVFHWTFIAIGSVLFMVIISLLSIIGAWLIQEIRYRQRFADFVATFSHELNSPLASIKLFAQTLRSGELGEAERRRFLDLILCDVERLHGQISNVLRSAQIQAKEGLQLEREPVDLGEFLEEYARARRTAIEWSERRAGLVVACAEEATVAMDRALFQQVLDNLVGNALKCGGTEVVLATASAPGDAVALEVRDDGQGIAEDDLEHVFERFGRSSGVLGRRRPGTGLGLYLVRSIVEAHDGTVVAISAGRDRGTTIRIVLPRAPGRREAGGEDREERSPTAGAGSPP